MCKEQGLAQRGHAMHGIRVLPVEDIRELIKKVGLKEFMLKLLDQLEKDYSRWDEFYKTPRHASYYPQGVIELMPITDKNYYAFKLVNGHPDNPKVHKLTVIATGMLAVASTGYPILISEMTILTAIRTGVTSAMASKYLVKKNVKNFGIIGTGAQSEFQAIAHHYILGVKEIYYFDIDPHAMEKFAANLKPLGLNLHPCKDAKSVVEKCDIVTTATAENGYHKVILESWVKPGTHINAIGGDSPGKTELDPALVRKCKIYVENFEQTKVEGEIQLLKPPKIFAELWELVTKKKEGRKTDEEITLYDSVGFAIEDYSILRLIYALSEEYKLGHLMGMIPDAKDPKDLFSFLK